MYDREIRSKRDLEIAYSTLKLIEDLECDKDGKKPMIDSIKRNIRKYYHRPESDRRYINADIDGAVAIITLPLSADVSKEDAEEYFMEHEYMESINSPYDCTGRSFTIWHTLVKRHGHWICYHGIGIDC